MTSRLLLACAGLFWSMSAMADGVPRPEPIDPGQLQWMTPPGTDRLQAAWVVGAGEQAGPYALRVRLGKGGRILPHTHPDLRYTTVLSGTLYVGFGRHFDEAVLVAVPAGSVYVAPAGVPHFLLARDGDVVYQEGGDGPTGLVPVDE